MATQIVTSENREKFIAEQLAKKAKKAKKATKAVKESKEAKKGEEFDEKKIKSFMKKYRKNEDKNYHSENAVELAKFLGHKEHEESAKDILKRHLERGYLDDEDSNKRRAIEKELWPRVSKYYEQE